MTIPGGCGGQHVAHDTAVATAEADTSRPIGFSAFLSSVCDAPSSLALAVLCVVSVGCFNPNHIGKPVKGENHVPVIDVLPAPTLTPITAAVSLDGGDDCAPTEFNFVSLDDDDGDTLTVRWDIVVRRIDRDVEVRQELKSSPPLLPLDDGSYAANDSTDLTLDANGALRRLGDLNAQVGADDDVFQMIELRVSDGGIVSDEFGEPTAPAGAGLVYRTWNVKLVPCVGGPV